jgi:hypothetical protein
MSPFTNLGPGDDATFPPYYGHPNDPRTPEPSDDDEDDEDGRSMNAGACPFCGDDGQVEETGLGTFVVVCEGCGAEGPRRTDPHEAIVAWDHRQPSNQHIPDLVRREVVRDLVSQLEDDR